MELPSNITIYDSPHFSLAHTPGRQNPGYFQAPRRKRGARSLRAVHAELRSSRSTQAQLQCLGKNVISEYGQIWVAGQDRNWPVLLTSWETQFPPSPMSWAELIFPTQPHPTVQTSPQAAPGAAVLSVPEIMAFTHLALQCISTSLFTWEAKPPGLLMS